MLQVIRRLITVKEQAFMRDEISHAMISAGKYNNSTGSAGNYVVGRLLFRLAQAAAPVILCQYRIDNPQCG